jgi:hypothetical protein
MGDSEKRLTADCIPIDTLCEAFARHQSKKPPGRRAGWLENSISFGSKSL